jgi:hypothetical protein
MLLVQHDRSAIARGIHMEESRLSNVELQSPSPFRLGWKRGMGPWPRVAPAASRNPGEQPANRRHDPYLLKPAGLAYAPYAA